MNNREVFEWWHKEKFPNSTFERWMSISEPYMDKEVQARFEGYQAGLSSVNSVCERSEQSHAQQPEITTKDIDAEFLKECADENGHCVLKNDVTFALGYKSGYQAGLASQAQQPTLVEISEYGEGQENDCPECGAESGESCSSSDGVEYGRKVHESRQSQAQQPTNLSEQLREYAGNSGYSHNDYADTMLAAAFEIERLTASQAQQEPVSQWISVEERLPEEGVNVAVCVINPNLKNSEVFCSGTGKILHGNWANIGHTIATHWMPLPPAPEGE